MSRTLTDMAADTKINSETLSLNVSGIMTDHELQPSVEGAKEKKASSEPLSLELKTAKEDESIPKLPSNVELIEIPKILHFVWVGTPMLKKYKRNIIRWKKLNPDYVFHLIMDKELLTTEQYDELKKYCDENKIIMINIEDKIKDPNNPVWYKRDLWAYYDSVNGENFNWAIASNILRALTLEEYGGIYLDTDIQPGRKPLGTIKVPKMGLMLSLIESPSIPGSLALADHIMGSTPNNPVIKEFSRLMAKNYKETLKDSEKIINLRSKILSNIAKPTYDLVGPDVVAEAFLNVEMGKIPPNFHTEREQIKNKILEDNFYYDLMFNLIEDHFDEYFDNTWITFRNEMAYKLYSNIMEDAVFKPLVAVLEKMENNGLKLSDELKVIKNILQQNLSIEHKVLKIREAIKQNSEHCKELGLYFRPDYIATLVMSEATKMQKLETLASNNRWSEFIKEFETFKNEANSVNTLETPRKYANEILQIASKNQHLEIYRLIFKNRNYNKLLTLAIYAGEISAVQALLSTGLELNAPIYDKEHSKGPTALEYAILQNQCAIAAVILHHMLSQTSGRSFTPNYSSWRNNSFQNLTSPTASTTTSYSV